MNVVLFVFICLFIYSDQRSTPESDSYVAAVLEYQVSGNVQENTRNYVQYIGEAAEKDADVVVFPEMTLTRGTRAVPVPINGILKDNPIPAQNPELYDEILVDISNASRQHQVYVVINVQEEMDCTVTTDEYCPESRVYLFNTNVVFDRTGAVIDRFRKINLFGEFTRFPALQPDLGIFTTDFGVTFGHFICFDLMFQVPAVQVVEKHNLTDIIFTTMWFSELPYLTAVQIQEAYAYALDVNFLASGANNVRVGSAGSGIYSGKAGAIISTMPGQTVAELLVARVPKVPGQVNYEVPGPIYEDPTVQDNLVLITDPSLPSHVSRLLENGSQEFTLMDKEVTCRFRVRLNQRNGQTIYKYRAAAFSGIRSFSGVETGGSRLCSVVACTGDTIDTCGKRFSSYTPNSTAAFEELTIVATMPTSNFNTSLEAYDSAFFPVSLDVSIMPLEPSGYNYDIEIQDEVTVYTLNLVNTEVDLYSFAVWGRVFERDGLDASPPIDNEYNETTTVGNEDTTVSPIDGNEPGSSVANAFNLILLAFGLSTSMLI